MDNLTQFSDVLVESVRKCVERATGPLFVKIAELEQRFALLPAPKDGVDGKDGVNGLNGKDADIGPVVDRLLEFCHEKTAQIPDIVQRAVAALPPPKDADEDAIVARVVALIPAPVNGIDGKNADEDAIVARVLAAIPTPANGVDGKDGLDGKDFDPSLVVSEVERVLPDMVKLSQDMLLERLDAAVAKIPPPADGKDGLNGKDVDPAVVQSLETSIADIRATVEAKSGEALTIAGKALETADEANATVTAVAAVPKAPHSFLLNEQGELVAVYPDGNTKTIGMARGKDGARGASIMDGSVDDSGQLVLRMSDGRIVNAGIVKGAPGKDGKGLPGRDANEIRVLPAIDEAKSYPEGTTALYRGGVIRAERTTDPIDGDVLKAGWRVALEGIAEETETELDDGRVIERTTTYTSGKTFARRLVTGAMIYRGIFVAGREYQPGDVVTWDGSSWHCNSVTTVKPGTSDDWKLTTKRGRDGKDGKNGEKGLPGRDLTK